MFSRKWQLDEDLLNELKPERMHKVKIVWIVSDQKQKVEKASDASS
jgi:hypothetical protein